MPNDSTFYADSVRHKASTGHKLIEKREKVGRRGFEPPGPAMSRRYPNQARPPAQHTMEKFVAQIYVVDSL